MKNILFFASVLAGFFLVASCQQESFEPEVSCNVVSYTIQVPGAIGTKAIGTDVTAVTELIYEVYRIDEQGAETKLYQKSETRDAANGETNWTVELELVNNQNFRVLFWAQVPENGVYTTTSLKEVKLATALNANAENYAAFAGQDEITYGENLAGRTVTLVRPVAQLNIATSAESLKLGEDENGANAQTTVSFETTAVTVEGLSTVYNVAEGAAGADEATFTYAAKPVALSETTLNVNGVDYSYVAMNYVGFAQPSGDNVKVTYTIETNEVGTITNTISNVPVKANHRTNIIGNLITSTSDYTVTLDRTWPAEEENVGVTSVSTASGLQEAINAIPDGVEGNITLEGNIDLVSTKAGSQSPGLNIPAGKSVTLDLNGYTLKQELECAGSYSMIVNNGTLTITGNGKVSFKDLSAGGGSTWGSYTIENHGALIVENGTIEHLGSSTIEDRPTNIPIQNYAGKVVVNGGIISSPTFRSLRDFTAGGEIIINGGQFLGQVWMQGLGTGSSSLTINGGEFNPTAGYDGSSVYITNTTNDVIVSITGGTFNTKIGCADSTKSGVKGCVTGGLFKVDPSNYVADGYYALKYADEEYYSLYDNFDPANRTLIVNSKEELLKLEELNANWANFFSNGEGTEYSNYAEQNGGKGVDFYYGWTWTIKLTADIDFGGETIEPINLGYRKCFDGQGHTIKNAKIETSSDAGLFNAAQCGLKNLVIENVQVKTSDNGATAGILASSCSAGVENITISNSSVYGGKYTGAVVGYGYTDVTNCSVTKCTVDGCYKCGGIIGYICASNNQTRKVDNNTLAGCTVDFTGKLTDGKTEFVCGMIVGNYNCNGTCSNNTIDNMTTVATGLIGRIEAGKNVTVTGTNFKVATTEALQAALDNATEGTTITLVPDVNYGLVYMGRPTKHNATVMACGEEFTTTNAVAFKNHISDGKWHTTPNYTTTLNNLTVVGAEGAKIAGLLATSGHSYGDVYDYVLDKDYDTGSAYYNTLNLSNVVFSNVDFTGKIDINTSDATSVYDGVTFDGCTFTTGGIASSNGASIRYYNEANNGNVKNIVVKNCSFTNSYQGVYVQNVNGVTVTDSRFDTTGHNAVAVQSTSDPVNMKNVVIKANNFNNIKDRVIRFGAIGADSNITIQNNTAVNSGDEDGEVMRAVSIAAGITTSISGNNWGEGKVVANDELKDK